MLICGLCWPNSTPDHMETNTWAHSVLQFCYELGQTLARGYSEIAVESHRNGCTFLESTLVEACVSCDSGFTGRVGPPGFSLQSQAAVRFYLLPTRLCKNAL